jgi:endonuclease YncB( thermonuclease family)
MARRVHTSRALAVALALLPMAMAQAPAGASPGATVISIGDGDTIRVRMNGKPITVRLACIDAPETAQRPHGQQARSYLQQRLPLGSTVTLEQKTTDRYGRLVADVFNGININRRWWKTARLLCSAST